MRLGRPAPMDNQVRAGRAWPRVLAVLVALVVLGQQAVAQRRPRITDVQVAPAQAELKVGASQPLQATAYDAVGNPSLTAVFAWSSSDRKVATVDRDGMVTGVAAGTAVISARTGARSAAKSGQATITVVGGVPPIVLQREPARAGAAAAKPDSSPRVTVPAFNPAAPARDVAAPAARAVVVPGSAALAKQPEGTGTADSLLVEPTSVRLTRRGQQQLAYRAIRANRQNAEKVPIVFAVDSGGDRIVRVDSVGMIAAVGNPGRAIVRVVVPGNRRIPAVAVAVEVAADSVVAPPPVAPPAVAPPVAVPSAAKGFLTVNATPYATVAIDGVDMGDTPLVRFALTPGDHTVRLVHDGYRTQQFPVKIEAGNELRVNKVLLREN